MASLLIQVSFLFPVILNANNTCCVAIALWGSWPLLASCGRWGGRGCETWFCSTHLFCIQQYKRGRLKCCGFRLPYNISRDLWVTVNLKLVFWDVPIHSKFIPVTECHFIILPNIGITSSLARKSHELCDFQWVLLWELLAVPEY